MHFYLFRRYLRVIHFQDNLSPCGEFRRIVGKIKQHLLNPNVISKKFIGKIRRHFQHQLHIFLFQPGLNNVGHIVYHGHGFIIHGNNIHFPGFYLGKIQNVVDNRKQRLSGFLNLVDIFPGRRRKLLTQCHFRHPYYRIHWSSDFMTHIGQKIRLHIGGFFHFYIGTVNKIFIIRHIGNNVRNDSQYLTGVVHISLIFHWNTCHGSHTLFRIYANLKNHFTHGFQIRLLCQNLPSDKTTYHFIPCHNRCGKICKPHMACIQDGFALLYGHIHSHSVAFNATPTPLRRLPHILSTEFRKF